MIGKISATITLRILNSIALTFQYGGYMMKPTRIMKLIEEVVINILMTCCHETNKALPHNMDIGNIEELQCSTGITT